MNMEKHETCPWCPAGNAEQGFNYDMQTCRCGWPRKLAIVPHASTRAANCSHHGFEADVRVNRLENVGRFAAEIEIHCSQCGLPFRFLGLPAGLNLDGAATSFGGEEVRLAIFPTNKDPSPLTVASGFSVKADN